MAFTLCCLLPCSASLYVTDQGMIGFIQTASKTESQTGRRANIPRLLTNAAGQLVLILVLLRPVLGGTSFGSCSSPRMLMDFFPLFSPSSHSIFMKRLTDEELDGRVHEEVFITAFLSSNPRRFYDGFRNVTAFAFQNEGIGILNFRHVMALYNDVLAKYVSAWRTPSTGSPPTLR